MLFNSRRWFRITEGLACSGLAVAMFMVPTAAAAATIDLTPVYSSLYTDAITGDNCSGMTISGGCTSNGWNVDAGADVYSQNLYERPTSQTFALIGGEYVATEYLGYLDIVNAQYGYTGLDTTTTADDWMFFQLTMFSPYLYKSDGTVDTGVFGSGTYYGIQLGSGDTGDGQLLIRAEQTKDTVNQTLFNSEKTQAFYDTNNSIGGATTLNGYESPLSTILYSRSFINADGTVSVELAINYAAYNTYCASSSLCSSIDPANLPYLVFEATRGLKDNQNYLWNEKYTLSEAGSPYNGSSLGNIYELDNLRASFVPSTNDVPEPGTLLLMGVALAAGVVRGRRQKRS